MDNIEVRIESPGPRPVFADEANLLLTILPPELIDAIAMIGCDETAIAEAAGLAEQR